MIFEALPGYFAAFPDRNTKEVDSSKIDHNKLVNQDSWKQLYNSLPSDTDRTHYKLLVLARHGQGYHNAAIERYGQKEWDRYWSFLNGDEHGMWLDSKLTPVGKKQVTQTGSDFLAPLIEDIGILPQAFFSSPMRRCLETFLESWNQVFERENMNNDNINVKVIENIRETLGEHPCDLRVPHSDAVGEYQDFKTNSGTMVQWNYEMGYPEEDQLYKPDHRETIQEMDERLHDGLSQIFNQLTIDDKFVSITCHAGVIQSILRNLKHPDVKNLNTGKTVCVVVKVSVNKNPLIN
ncbi:hypothetical protein KAFR_0D03000 [Kazachstania africana CBS 2517]|uniref:Phosphoglycerate mutase n=1 Tax=Kazachstania africana (strain ATCC 22294 / BCRC 22015 / CBS 2517 / CECT 1963 / NBRC 1671 / NRRL Y-8276) TaxID=1071382 RepID=H2AU98_KAZAF|nr:hypothetical protein KAFR_0D03000 [Kazachstania africana CBS 2517]CCF57948.1 hypothetical protein KAFR_0D03000 [Kazachstania africana CBS 2517]